MNTRSESQEELTGRPKISQEEIFKAYTLVLNKTREFCATRQISVILPASNSRCFEFIQEKMYWFGDVQNPDLILFLSPEITDGLNQVSWFQDWIFFRETKNCYTRLCQKQLV